MEDVTNVEWSQSVVAMNPKSGKSGARYPCLLPPFSKSTASVRVLEQV